MEAGRGGGGGGMNSLLSSLEDLHHPHPHPPNDHLHKSQTSQNSQHQDDFLEQMLSTINPNCGGWSSHNINANGHDLSPSNPNPNPKSCDSPPNEDPELGFHYPNDEMNGGKSFLLHRQLQLLSRDSSLLPSLPLSLATVAADSHPDVFKSPTPQPQTAADNYNGFAGSQLHGNQQHFHHPPQPQTQGGVALAGQNYGGQAAVNVNVNVMNQPPAPVPSASTGGSSGAAPQRQRVRARRGQATDPHSIAERLRRERIAERMKALQELVPNANKTDKASMLDEIIEYVKFLQLQVKVLSMSRLGGAGAVAPLVTDMSSEGGGGGVGRSSSTKESMTVTEHQVAKLMEEDMGSAMQYLQGKGLCLMPISLATAISTATATCHSRNPPRPHTSNSNMSVQSATLQDNASGDHPSAASLKDTVITTNPASSSK